MKKTIALVITLALVGAFALNATMAYLTGETGEVKNAFVIGDINIELTEDGWGPEFKGKIIPGEEIPKEPIVTVVEGSEKCYLYMYLKNQLAVKTTDTTKPWEYVTPNIDLNQWEKVPSVEIVDSTTGAKKELYRYKVGTGESVGIIDAANKLEKVTFFTNVKVPDISFTKASMQELANHYKKTPPTITVQAFAYQSEHVDEKDATIAAINWFKNIT